MDELPGLPDGIDIRDGQSLIEWAEELGVHVHFEILEHYPALPMRLSEYTMHPPEIRLRRYIPWEPWLQEVCERRLLFFAPWYLIFLARELYKHLEYQGFYELRAPWYRLDLLWQWRSLETRSNSFARDLLGLIRPPHRLDAILAEALRIDARPASK